MYDTAVIKWRKDSYYEHLRKALNAGTHEEFIREIQEMTEFVTPAPTLTQDLEEL
jgi:hypothetical protein